MKSTTANRSSVFRLITFLLDLAVLLGPSVLFSNIYSTVGAQQTGARYPIAFPTTIHWPKQRGVTKYRLQISDDEKFSNVFYDGPVIGERYMATGLAPGYYYWRIAPVGSHTGAFLKPVRFFVSGGVVVSGFVPVSPAPRPRLPAMPTSRVR